MTGYERYVQDLNNLEKNIKDTVTRIEKLKEDDNIWFDQKEADECISFIERKLKMEDWEQYIISSLSLKYKGTDKRVCRELLILTPRKNGTTTLVSAIAAYYSKNGGRIGCLSNSRYNASIPEGIVEDFGGKADTYSRNPDPAKWDFNTAILDGLHKCTERLYNALKDYLKDGLLLMTANPSGKSYVTDEHRFDFIFNETNPNVGVSVTEEYIKGTYNW